MYQEPAITNIKELINDVDKTIILLKQFDDINKKEFNNQLDNIIIDVNNENTLIYLIILLKMSFLSENKQ